MGARRGIEGGGIATIAGLGESSPHDSVRQSAAAVVKKLEARSHRVDLPDASPAMLPRGYASTSIEFDTHRVPELLSNLEQELKGHVAQEVRRELEVSANQIQRGRRRFHIVPVTLVDGTVSQLGFGLYAEARTSSWWRFISIRGCETRWMRP